jgi:hypothetical protein
VEITKVRLQAAESREDDRSKLRAGVGRMHCVPLAAMYAAYVASCLTRGDAIEDMQTFEARLRKYFALGNDRGVWADRPVILDGIVYGVWFNEKTRRFVVDPGPATTTRVTAITLDESSINPPTSVGTITTEPRGTHRFPQIRGGQAGKYRTATSATKRVKDRLAASARRG